MKTNKKDAKRIARLLFDNDVVKLSPEVPFTWTSGLKSPIYCNNRLLLSRAEDMDRDDVIDLLRVSINENFGACGLVGVATGAIPWASMIAYTMGEPLGYVISAPKDHGADSNQSSPKEEQAKLAKCLIGEFPENSKLVIIEDLISTGVSSLHAVNAVRAAGYEVSGMVALFSYGFEEAKKSFETANCTALTLCDYDTLLEVALEDKYINEEQLLVLKEWRLDHRAWSKAHGGK